MLLLLYLPLILGTCDVARSTPRKSWDLSIYLFRFRLAPSGSWQLSPHALNAVELGSNGGLEGRGNGNVCTSEIVPVLPAKQD
jgi:hypothetical protein